VLRGLENKNGSKQMETLNRYKKQYLIRCYIVMVVGLKKAMINTAIIVIYACVAKIKKSIVAAIVVTFSAKSI
jgi:hypothetical protein